MSVTQEVFLPIRIDDSISLQLYHQFIAADFAFNAFQLSQNMESQATVDWWEVKGARRSSPQGAPYLVMPLITHLYLEQRT